MSEKTNEPIKEGDFVRVPITPGTPSHLSSYGIVLYLNSPLAVVTLTYGTRVMRQTFRVADLVKMKKTKVKI